MDNSVQAWSFFPALIIFVIVSLLAALIFWFVGGSALVGQPLTSMSFETIGVLPSRLV